VLIALLMIAAGGLATRPDFRSPATSFTRTLWRLAAVGIGLALYVFMTDAIGAASRGLDVRMLLPTSFNWPLYGVAFALMAAPVVHAAWEMGWRRRALPGDAPAMASERNPYTT
jgi:hypothetical protein